jgi:hypothetical protein
MAKTNKQTSLTLKQLIAKNYGCSEKVLSDLKAGLQRDFTIREACVYAGIHHDSYYRWLKESDEFALEMEKAQQFISNKAKEVIMDGILQGDRNDAKWWLERRRKENYSTKSEQEYSGTLTIKPIHYSEIDAPEDQKEILQQPTDN